MMMNANQANAGSPLTLWVVSHPKHGLSIRTTPCYPNGNSADHEPEGWSETPVGINWKTIQSLKNLLVSI